MVEVEIRTKLGVVAQLLTPQTIQTWHILVTTFEYFVAMLEFTGYRIVVKPTDLPALLIHGFTSSTSSRLYQLY